MYKRKDGSKFLKISECEKYFASKDEAVLFLESRLKYILERREIEYNEAKDQLNKFKQLYK